MSKFTPGPWQWGGDDPEGWRYPTSVWRGRRFIAATDGMTAPCEGSHKEQIANARLIAAAPELYEALQGLCYLEEYSDHRKDGPAFAAARAALAKACGK